MLRASGRLLGSVAKQPPKIWWSKKLDPKHGLTHREQAGLDRVELTARRRNNAGRMFVLPGGWGMLRKPLRDTALPCRVG